MKFQTTNPPTPQPEKVGHDFTARLLASSGNWNPTGGCRKLRFLPHWMAQNGGKFILALDGICPTPLVRILRKKEHYD
jgi:hypothetical protein